LLLFCWIYCISLLLAPLLLLQFQWFSRFDESLSSCIILSQLLSCLTMISSVFFFNFYFIFELWNSVLHLFWSAGVIFHCAFCLIKGTFYFQDFCFILFS
jgi:hypothetical protein